MAGNLFATYNAPNPPEIQPQEHIIKFENLNQDNYYKQYIPQIIIQQEAPVEEDTNELDNPDSIEEDTLQIDIPQLDNSLPTALKVVDTARSYIGMKYILGGKDPKNGGFDCSGLIHYVYAQNGIETPYMSKDFRTVGTEVKGLNNVRPGDIICTEGHVKMVSKIEDGHIYVIEAKGRKWGVVENILNKTNNIITIRRVINDNSTLLNTPQTSLNIKTSTNGKFQSHVDFVKTLNQCYQYVLKNRGLDPRYSYILVAQDAIESGWGKHLAGNFNYGGIKAKTGTKKTTYEYLNGKRTLIYDSFRNFNSMQDYCNYKINLLSNKRYQAFDRVSAANPSQFIANINGSGYSTTPNSRYVPYVMGVYKTIIKLLGY